MKTQAIAASLVLALGFAAAAPVFAKPKGPARTEAAAKRQAPATKGGKFHTVKRGETLYSIAEKEYGNGLEWVRLKEYNDNIDDPDLLAPGTKVYIPDRLTGNSLPGRTSLDPGGRVSLFGWLPNLNGVTFFGKTVYQIFLILMVWFLLHFTIEGLFVWFAAHLTFVNDVSIKKAMKATLQAESLAFLCFLMACAIGLMLLYVGTTSPGKPVTPELLGTAEEYLGSSSGMMVAGLLIVGLYGFLGIRFIPPAFGVQAGRGVALVMISILIPHLIGFYLVGHRMGLIN